MESKLIEWKNILYYHDILNLLDYSDIIHFSLTCKFLRTKLKFSNYNYLYYGAFSYNQDLENTKVDSNTMKRYNFYYEDIFGKKLHILINRFELDFLDKSHTIQVHNYKPTLSYYHSYNINNNFLNVSHLNLYFATLPLKLLQYLLDSLKLKQLTAERMTIFNDSHNLSLTLPQTLEKIKYEGCSARLITDNISTNDYLYYESANSYFVFFLYPQYIQRLQTLSYSNFEVSENNETTNFIDFLTLNPQLKSIMATQEHFQHDAFKILSTSNQVKHISIDHFEFTRNYEFTLPIISNLETLEISLDFEFDYSMELIQAFPNLTKFIVKFNYTLDNFNILWFAANIKKLKYLTLSFYETLEFSEFIKFPEFAQIEVIEFYNANPNLLYWDDLCLMKKLKFIKFYGDFVNGVESRFQSKVQELENWKIVYYNESIVYHKV